MLPTRRAPPPPSSPSTASPKTPRSGEEWPLLGGDVDKDPERMVSPVRMHTPLGGVSRSPVGFPAREEEGEEEEELDEEELLLDQDVDKPQFDVKLFARFQRFLGLPEVPELVGGNRWVVVKAESGFHFKVFMKRKFGRYKFVSGWELVVASENLQERQIVHFEMFDQNTFSLWNDDHHRRGPPIGFSTARTSGTVRSWNQSDYIRARGIILTPKIIECMHRTWAFSAGDSMMDVCSILPSQLRDKNGMFFSCDYSKLIPKDKRILALRLLGSPVIIPGNLSRSNNGTARIGIVGWQLFVKEHHICANEVMIFMVHRGPSVWEMVACRSGVMVV